MSQSCVVCGCATSATLTLPDGFTTTIGVNRLPTDGGWMCWRCAGFDCDKCGEPISLDTDWMPYPDEGWHFHETCLTEEERALCEVLETEYASLLQDWDGLTAGQLVRVVEGHWHSDYDCATCVVDGTTEPRFCVPFELLDIDWERTA